MKEPLDRDRIRELLKEADDLWFNKHPRPGWRYGEHLDFQADYLVQNYKGKGR